MHNSPEQLFGAWGEQVTLRAMREIMWGDVFSCRNSRTRIADLLLICGDESKLPIQVKTTAGSKRLRNVFLGTLNTYRKYVEIAERHYNGAWLLAVVNVFHKRIFLFEDRYLSLQVQRFEAGRAVMLRFDYSQSYEPRSAHETSALQLTVPELAEGQALAKSCPDQLPLFV